MLSASVNGWTDIGVGHWTDIDLILLTLAALSFGLRLKGSALFHTHTTLLTTEVFLLLVLVHGTPGCYIFDRM